MKAHFFNQSPGSYWCGDTFLSLAGLCLGGGLSSDVALFLGSAVAALDVQVVCNRESIASVNLYKYINVLLKS